MNLKAKIKNTRYVLEALVVRFGLALFFLLGPKKASDIGASIARFVGKKISVHKLAYRNLSNAMPQLEEHEKTEILDDMWDNLGRIVGEFVHIAKCPLEKLDQFFEITEETQKNFEALKQSGKGGIFFSGHIGNWEIGPKAFLKNGIKTHTVYRPLNNPYVEKMTGLVRGVPMIGKSSSGNRKIIEVIKNGGFVIILADQKISEGEQVKFFHDVAATTTSIAKMALKYDIPLIPVRSIRLGRKFKFLVEVEKPLAFQRGNNINSDTLLLTRKINETLEKWITEYPSQWFWVHNRWKR
jgi:KDO2-lipid IV(A) lauroyltransferase